MYMLHVIKPGVDFQRDLRQQYLNSWAVGFKIMLKNKMVLK